MLSTIELSKVLIVIVTLNEQFGFYSVINSKDSDFVDLTFYHVHYKVLEVYKLLVDKSFVNSTLMKHVT